MSFFDQMGNIGSEVGRALNAKKNGDEASMQAAFRRGLDLIDASSEQLASHKSPRLKELLRAREQFAQAILSDIQDETLEQYFMDFAMAARLHR